LAWTLPPGGRPPGWLTACADALDTLRAARAGEGDIGFAPPPGATASQTAEPIDEMNAEPSDEANAEPNAEPNAEANPDRMPEPNARTECQNRMPKRTPSRAQSAERRAEQSRTPRRSH